VIRVKFLVILILTFFIAQYLSSTAYSIGLYAFVTLPGTFLHELAHYMSALFLGGLPSNFNLIPSGNTLGSVRFHPNWYNAASVAMAPFLLAPLTFLVAALGARAVNPFKTLFFSYLAACSWVASTPSPQDFQIAMVPASWPLAFFLLIGTTYLIYKTTRILVK